MRATRDAINEMGLPAVTAREIVGRASANLAAIPYHFGSKDALVTEALIAEAHELLAPVLALLASDQPAAERAGTAIAMLGDIFDASRSKVPTYLAALAAAPHSPAVRTGLAELWRELRARLADDVQRQLDAGLVPSWTDPDAAAAMVLALANGVVIAAVIDPDGPDHGAVASQFLGLLLASATPRATGREPR